MSTESDGPTPPRVCMGLALTVGLAAASAALPMLPRAGEPVAILTLFGTQATLIAAIAHAGGALAGLRGNAIALAVPRDPDFIARMRRLGYWLVLDAQAIDLCGPSPTLSGGNLGRQPL